MATKAVRVALKPQLKKRRLTEKRPHVVESGYDNTSGIAVLNIREARINLPQIVNSVATGFSRVVVIGRHGVPTAAIVPADLIVTLMKPGDKKRKLAALIVEELLADAPLHLKTPAVDELSRLPQSDLDKLWKIERLPLGKDRLASLQAKLAHPEALTRLVQRFDVATAIAKAREAGLYEIAEHATSRLTDNVGGATE